MSKKNQYTTYIEIVVMFILFGGLIFVSTKLGIGDNLKSDTAHGKVLGIIGVLVIAHFVLAVHELGHLIVGLLQGFRFDLFVIGLLGIKREDDQIKVYLNKNLGFYGGVASSSPIDDSPDNPKKFARVLLAGPIASVLFAFLCFALCGYVGKPYGLAMYTGGIMSIGIFLATTIPSRTGMFFTDRKRFQRLVIPGKDQDVELAMLDIMGKFSLNNSYKNIDKKQIQLLMEDELPFISSYGYFNMICWLLENEGIQDPEIMDGYKLKTTAMSKAWVDSLDKEIANYTEKYMNTANVG